MNWRAVGVGVITTLIVTLPEVLLRTFPGFAWGHPVVILCALAGLFLVFRLTVATQAHRTEYSYSGLSNLLLYVHEPPRSGKLERWAIRGMGSFILALFGGFVDSIGPAIELSKGALQKLRSRSSHWFEQQRRTDVSVILSAALTAGFGTPLAAIVFPFELGVGGRTPASLMGAMSALITREILSAVLPFSLFRFSVPISLEWSLIGTPGHLAWLGAISVIVPLGLGLALIGFTRMGQRGLTRWISNDSLRMGVGAVGLGLLALSFPSGNGNPAFLLNESLLRDAPASDSLFFALSRFLSLSLILATMGSIGIFWPIFSLGGWLGWIFHDPVLVYACGAGALAVTLGTPLTAAVLAFELTRNLPLFLIVLATSTLIHTIRTRLRVRSLYETDLELHGLQVREGRSVSVLDALLVDEAMIRDHTTIHEHAPIEAVRQKLSESRYPFLVVVNAQEKYAGVLTTDIIEDAWITHQESKNRTESLSQLLEAKDLVYRHGMKIPTITNDSPLSGTQGLFETTPVLPVIDQKRVVLGLLFAFNVRIAYEQETARRALAFARPTEHDMPPI